MAEAKEITKDNILVIEDDELFLKTLISLLKKEGYEVYSARTGQEAIELAKKKCFDLLITDIRLTGGMDGLEVLKNIKDIYSHPNKMIVMTGYVDDEAPIRAIRLGVNDYIYKPFRTEDFLHSVKRNLDTLRLEKQEKKFIEDAKEMRKELEEYNTQLENLVKEKTSELTILFEIGREITSSLRLNKVLSTIVERISDVLGIERCSIVLLDENKDELFIAAAKGVPQEVISQTRIKRGKEISGRIFENKEPILVEDIEKDPRFAKENEERYYTGSFISVPLIFKGRAIGVINVNNKRSREIFSKDDLRFVEGVANQASIAIENARLYSNLEGIYLQIVSALTSVIELKDHYTKGHSDRVTKYAMAIAEAMGLSPSQVEIIRLSCQLHDLGKIGIQEYILTKPAKLTEEEWGEIKLHPLKGVEILRPLTFLKDEMKLVEQHHERYDGKGYPYGLHADSIDVRARIMAVADSFDAMTTERPYAKGLTLSEAKEEIRRCGGTQFDPKIVEVFINLLDKTPDLFKKS